MPLNITRPPVGPVLTYDVNTQRPGCDVDSGRETGERPLPPAHEAKIKFLPLPEAVPAPGCCRVVYRRNSYSTTVNVVALTFIRALYFIGLMFM